MSTAAHANGPPRAHRAGGALHAIGDNAPVKPVASAPLATSLNTPDDKIQRLQEENRQLKVSRNELDQKVKELNTKFQRLLRDFNAGRASGALAADDPHRGSSAPPTTTSASSSDPQVQRIINERDDALRRLGDAARTIEMLQADNDTLRRALNAAGKGGTGGPHSGHHGAAHIGDPFAVSSEVQRLKAQSAIDLAKIDALSEERNQLRTQLQLAIAHTGGQSAATAAASNAVSKINEERLLSEVATLRAHLAAANAAADGLSREKDDYKAELARWKATGANAAVGASGPQFLTVQDHADFSQLESAQRLQLLTSEKVAQLTVLAHRLEQSQSQVSVLTMECDRLVVELKSMHQACGDMKKRLFQLEAEKASSDVKAQRATELESALNLRQEELMRCEQELLRMIDALQTCGRETEIRVRQDCSTRFAEMTRMKDDADRERRNKERQNYALSQEVADLKRTLRTLEEEVASSRQLVTDATKAKNELADEIARLHRIDSVASVTAVERANSKAEAALKDLATGVEWNDRWEAENLHEALSQLQLEKELSDARSAQLETSIKELTTALEDIKKQRDELLAENLKLRRLGGTSSSLLHPRPSIAAIRGASRAASAKYGDDQLVLAIDDVQWLDGGSTQLNAIDELLGSTASLVGSTLFFSIDGPLESESGVSDCFVRATSGAGSTTSTAAASSSISFQTVLVHFTGLPLHDGHFVQQLSARRFTVQLHQVHADLASRVVASGDFDLRSIVRSAERTVTAQLTDAEGEIVALVTVRLEHMPALAAERLRGQVGGVLEPSFFEKEGSREAAMIALRVVSGLRISIVKCDDLSMLDGRTPQPYVFYVGTFADDRPSPCGFLGDTVVHARTRAITTSPVFDVAPKEHPFENGVITEDVLNFMDEGKITFVVLDMMSTDVAANLGAAQLPLRAMLAEGNGAVVQRSLRLHPKGSLDVVVSWIRLA